MINASAPGSCNAEFPSSHFASFWCILNFSAVLFVISCSSREGSALTTHRLWAAPASPQEHPRQWATGTAEPTNHSEHPGSVTVSCANRWTRVLRLMEEGPTEPESSLAPEAVRWLSKPALLLWSSPYLPLLLYFNPICFLLVSLGGSGLCSSANLHLRNTSLGFQRHPRARPFSRMNSAFTERVSCSPSERFSPRLGNFNPPQRT